MGNMKAIFGLLCLAGIMFWVMAAEASPVLLHFYCPTVGSAVEVAANVSNYQYGISPLPGGCQWTTGLDLPQRVAELVAVKDSWFAEDGTQVFIGQFEFRGRTYYSAGYLEHMS